MRHPGAVKAKNGTAIKKASVSMYPFNTPPTLLCTTCSDPCVSFHSTRWAINQPGSLGSFSAKGDLISFECQLDFFAFARQDNIFPLFATDQDSHGAKIRGSPALVLLSRGSSAEVRR